MQLKLSLSGFLLCIVLMQLVFGLDGNGDDAAAPLMKISGTANFSRYGIGFH